LERQPNEQHTQDSVWQQIAIHKSAVFAVCLANTKSLHDAEDITQSVLLKASEKAKSLREAGQVKSWLLKMARNACVDHYRRRRRTTPLVEEPTAAEVTESDSFSQLYDAIKKLPTHYAEIVTLFYLEEQSCATAAEYLGITVEAARQRLVRARTLLHKYLIEDELCQNTAKNNSRR